MDNLDNQLISEAYGTINESITDDLKIGMLAIGLAIGCADDPSYVITINEINDNGRITYVLSINGDYVDYSNDQHKDAISQHLNLQRGLLERHTRANAHRLVIKADRAAIRICESELQKFHSSN